MLQQESGNMYCRQDGHFVLDLDGEGHQERTHDPESDIVSMIC